MRAKLFIALGALVAIGWAVPRTGAAHFLAEPGPLMFNGKTTGTAAVEKDRGPLVTAG